MGFRRDVISNIIWVKLGYIDVRFVTPFLLKYQYGSIKGNKGLISLLVAKTNSLPSGLVLGLRF